MHGVYVCMCVHRVYVCMFARVGTSVGLCTCVCT